MKLVKSLLRTLWGVNEPEVDLAPPIDCQGCAEARASGKDACSEHHTHHSHNEHHMRAHREA